MDSVKITERGWAGHFCSSRYCLFRRNTLLEYNDKKWIVSTVGNMIDPLTDKPKTIGCDRWYETMAFEAGEAYGYIDADTSKDIYFDSECGLYSKTLEELQEKYPDIDNVANDMHEAVVAELAEKIKQ